YQSVGRDTAASLHALVHTAVSLRCNRDKSFGELFAGAGGTLLSLRHDSQLFLFIIYERIGWDTLHEKNVAADCRSCTNHGFATQNRGSGVNRHVILDRWVAFSPFFDFAVLVFLKAARAERNRVVKLNTRADLRRLADHYASAMIDEKIFADLRAWMNIDAGSAVRPLRHDSWNQWHLIVKHVGQSINRNGFQSRIRENDLLVAFCSRVPFVGCVDIGPKHATYRRQLLQKHTQNFFRFCFR